MQSFTKKPQKDTLGELWRCHSCCFLPLLVDAVLTHGNVARYLHVRFRQFAEAITFSRGEGEAKHSADEMLEILLRVQLDVIYKEMPLKCMSALSLSLLS